MDSQGYAIETGEMACWGPPPSQTYQMPQVNYDHGKNQDWGRAAPHNGGYRESRHHGARSKPQWAANSSRRRQHPKYAPECARVPPPPPAQAPMGGTNSEGFQESQGPAVVNLQGLPASLCRQTLLEAMLDQAGLTNDITNCVVGKDKEVGKALLYFTNRASAQMCVEHFAGCCWDRNGGAVTAFVMKDDKPTNGMLGQTAATHGGPQRRSSRTAQMQPPPPPAPVPEVFGGAIAMQLVPVAVPLATVPWGDFAHNQPKLPEGAFEDEGSTVTGHSSRASWDTNADSPYACDTDDGF